MVYHDSVAVDLHFLGRFRVELIADDRLGLMVVVKEAPVVNDMIVSLQEDFVTFLNYREKCLSASP